MKNWAGNYSYRAREVVRPRSFDELRDVVRVEPSFRVIGSRHSFNDVADTDGVLISLEDMPHTVEVDGAQRSVRIDGAVRYGDICAAIDAAGLALHNMASLPHISVAGAVTTGTHGSGAQSGNLATPVSALTLMKPDGELVHVRRGDPDFSAAVVSLGALGVVVYLTLELEPAYRVRQDVYRELPHAAFTSYFSEIASAAESVSFFTDWRSDVIDQVWLKSRLPVEREIPSELFGARAATHNVHPIRSMPPEACTPQLGVPGAWHERLPHFRMDHTPSSGDELQSEFFVAFEQAVPAFEAVLRFAPRLADLVQVTEIRTIAPDEMWLSPCYERASAAIHFTWQPDWPSVKSLLPDIEAALAPFAPRPHWGKLFTMAPSRIRAAYPRFHDFVELVARYDPHGKLRNAYLARLTEA